MRLTRLIAFVAIGAVAISSAACVSRYDSPTALQSELETVVLLHGLGRSPTAMAPLFEHLESAGYQIAIIGYPSLGARPEEIMREVTEQVDACCAGNSAKVHFVGHSLGGLIVRAYLANSTVSNLG